MYWLLSLCAQTLGQRTVEEKYPAYFEPMGQVIYSGRLFTIPIRLEVSTLLDQITPLEDNLKTVSDSYEELRKLMGDTPTSMLLTEASKGRTVSHSEIQHFPPFFKSSYSAPAQRLEDSSPQPKVTTTGTRRICPKRLPWPTKEGKINLCRRRADPSLPARGDR